MKIWLTLKKFALLIKVFSFFEDFSSPIEGYFRKPRNREFAICIIFELWFVFDLFLIEFHRLFVYLGSFNVFLLCHLFSEFICCFNWFLSLLFQILAAWWALLFLLELLLFILLCYLLLGFLFFSLVWLIFFEHFSIV